MLKSVWNCVQIFHLVLSYLFYLWYCSITYAEALDSFCIGHNHKLELGKIQTNSPQKPHSNVWSLPRIVQIFSRCFLKLAPQAYVLYLSCWCHQMVAKFIVKFWRFFWLKCFVIRVNMFIFINMGFLARQQVGEVFTVILPILWLFFTGHKTVLQKSLQIDSCFYFSLFLLSSDTLWLLKSHHKVGFCL